MHMPNPYSVPLAACCRLLPGVLACSQNAVIAVQRSFVPDMQGPLLHCSCKAWQLCTNPIPNRCTMSHEVILMQGWADVCARDWVGDSQEGQD